MTALDTMDRCAELQNPEPVNFAVSCLIIVGLVISYLPQIWRIINRRSSEGLSPYFIMLGALAGTCAVANILTLPTSQEDMHCCKHNSAFACASALLGIAQITLQWGCFFVIMFLFLIFIPRRAVQDEYNGPVRAEGKEVTEALIIVAAAVIHFIITVFLSVLIFFRFPKYLQGWANFLGVIAAILAAVQYLPQIWTTWRLQHIGSLSIPMMCIQTPGGFVFAASLYFRLGPSGWSAWAVYLLLGSLQGCLLAMALRFEYRDRHEKGRAASASSVHDGAHDDLDDEGSYHVEGEGANEQSPLLTRAAPRRSSYQNTLYPGPLQSAAERRGSSDVTRSKSDHNTSPERARKPQKKPHEALTRFRKFGTVG